MVKTWPGRPFLRMALIAGGLMLVLSGCHLHHGYVHGGYSYYDGGGHRGGMVAVIITTSAMAITIGVTAMAAGAADIDRAVPLQPVAAGA